MYRHVCDGDICNIVSKLGLNETTDILFLLSREYEAKYFFPF